MRLYLIKDVLKREVYILANDEKEAIEIYNRCVGIKLLNIKILTNYVFTKNSDVQMKGVQNGE